MFSGIKAHLGGLSLFGVIFLQSPFLWASISYVEFGGKVAQELFRAIQSDAGPVSCQVENLELNGLPPLKNYKCQFGHSEEPFFSEDTVGFLEGKLFISSSSRKFWNAIHTRYLRKVSLRHKVREGKRYFHGQLDTYMLEISLNPHDIQILKIGVHGGLADQIQRRLPLHENVVVDRSSRNYPLLFTKKDDVFDCEVLTGLSLMHLAFCKIDATSSHVEILLEYQNGLHYLDVIRGPGKRYRFSLPEEILSE